MKPDTFRDYVLEQLTDLDGISWRPMFSGTGLYLDGTFFGIISDGALYVRVSESTLPQFVSYGSRHFQPSDDFESKKYFEIPAEVLDNPRELMVWVRQAAQAKRYSDQGKTKRRKSI